MRPTPLPGSGGPAYVTDGGLETDLIYNRGFDLPAFAAFPLLYDDAGRSTLADYYGEYADIARRAEAGLLLATPTWRANPDWAAELGYGAGELDHANREAVAFVAELAERWGDLPAVLVSGIVGPRGDGYLAGERPDIDEARHYHQPQIESFAAAGADLVEAMTMTSPQEAAGVARAANVVGLPVGILFTVETDGRLPDGTSLRDAIRLVDEAGDVEYFGVNCAHPDHVIPGLSDAAELERLVEVRPNASTKTHEELDVMEELDAGDISALASGIDGLRARLPSLEAVGGCCGTDARHVAALWGLDAT